MEAVILGGLGGGGDVGLAVILSHNLRNDARVVFASFAGCSPEKYPGERVAVACLSLGGITQGISSGP